MSADNEKNPSSRRLVDAVREVKIAAAERSDVVVEMKEADRARLEILANNLQPVFDDVPLDDERFDFVISSGLQPRLWIDATAHVQMGRDRRVYRFVRDTRLGRIVLSESRDAETVGEAVTRYIAERLHEREMAFAGDEIVMRRGAPQRVAEISSPVTAATSGEPDAREKPVKSDNSAVAARLGQSSSATGEDMDAGNAELPRAARTSTTSASWIGWLIVGLFVGGGTLLLALRDQILP